MKKTIYLYQIILLLIVIMSCNQKESELLVTVFETSESGNHLTKVSGFTAVESAATITLNPLEKFQTISGFGGAFTEASAYLLNQLSEKNRDSIMQAYFGKEGANYSLTRTHMNSCDFSLSTVFLFSCCRRHDIGTFYHSRR